MALKVKLLKATEGGCWAQLESQDQEYSESMVIAGSRNTSINKVCKTAATRLRTMALRFEALANEKEPYQVVTQKKINRRGIKSFE